MQNLFNLLEFIKKVFLSVTKPIPGFFTVLQSSEGNCKLKIKDVTGKDLVVDFGGKRVGSDNGSLFLYDASLRYFDKKIESPEDMDIALNLLREVQSFLFRNHQDVYNRCASSLGVALPPVLPSLPTSAAAAASSSTISALAPIPQPRHIPVPVVVRVSVELGARFIKLYNTVDSLQQRAQEVEISSSVGRSKVQAIFYNAFHKCVLLHQQGKTCGLICGCGEITYYEEGLGDESSRIYYNNHDTCSRFVDYLSRNLVEISSSTISAAASIPQPRHIPAPVFIQVTAELGARFMKLYNIVDSLQQRAQEVEISSSVGRSKVQAIFYNAFHKCVLLHQQGKTYGLIYGISGITYYDEKFGDESSRIYHNDHGICSNFVNYLLAGLSTVLSSAAATSQATGTQRQPSDVGLSSQASFFAPAPARDTVAVAPEMVPSQRLSN